MTEVTNAFIFGDMHGRWFSLEALLKVAGVLNEDGERITSDLVISIGDLANCTFGDINNDEEILRKSEGIVDYIVLGNHEAAYTHPHLGFAGFAHSPVINTLINGWLRNSRLVPAINIGDLLITHAGVNAAFGFKTAEDAFDAIWDIWINYYEYANPVPGGSTPMGGEPWQFKGKRLDWASLFDGIGMDRGGRARVAGILWDDWSQPKNTKFSQIVGHTPIKNGPVLHRYLGTDAFTVNIDCGAKRGLIPWGVWTDGEGDLQFEVVREVDDAQADEES